MEDYTFKLNTHFAPSHPATTTITPLEAASNQLLGISTTIASPLATKPTDPEPLDPNQLRDFNLMLDQMGLLADYKRNTWMTVGAMCVALCTSSFFLFILPITELCKKRELLMGIIDLLSFTAIPILLTMRVYIVEALNATLAPGMLGAHKILSAERPMNILQCTILPREKLPYCSDVVLSTIFPIILLKYLIILAILTLAYIAVAYLIEWCIRHWFPHKRPDRNTIRHSCCLCTPNSQATQKAGTYNRCPSMSSIRPLRQYQNRSYVPVLVPANNAPVPLLSKSEEAPFVAVGEGDQHH